MKGLARPLFKRRRFRTPFDSQDVKASQTVVKSAWECFYYIFWSLWGKIIWKITPLVICEILGVFVNTLVVDGKHPLWNFENLLLPIQMQLSKKQETFLHFFVSFQEFTSSFKHFKKKVIVIANVFLKLQSVKNSVRPLSKKPSLRTPFDSQHGKGFQTLVESAWEQFYHLFHHSERNWFGKGLS